MSRSYPARLARTAFGVLRPALGLLALLTLLAGCDVPASLVWSPDGSKAAYSVDTRGYVLDRQGKVLNELDIAPLGGYAFGWSADSATLYYAGTSRPDAAAVRAMPRDAPAWTWLDPPERPADGRGAPAVAAAGATTLQVVGRWRDGFVPPACEAVGSTVRVRPSPDGKWLAGVSLWKPTPADEGDVGEFLVFAHSLQSGRTYVVARRTGIGLCFTGPRRLAYVRTPPRDKSEKSDKPDFYGRVVELELADAPAAPRREPLPDAVPPTVLWLEPCGGGGGVKDGGDVLLSYVRLPPGTTRPAENSDLRWTLARFDRGRGALKTLAEDTDGLFAANPAGEKVLFQQSAGAKADDPQHRQLCVVNADGTGRRVVRDIKWTADGRDHYDDAMFPSWRGNDRFYIATPAGPPVGIDGLIYDRIVYFDVHLYELAGGDGAAGDAFRHVAPFGDDWPRGMKPRIRYSSERQAKSAPRPGAAGGSK